MENTTLYNSFLASMQECIRFFSQGQIPESDILSLAEIETSKLDFSNQWQMHKGIGYFAKLAVSRYLAEC